MIWRFQACDLCCIIGVKDAKSGAQPGLTRHIDSFLINEKPYIRILDTPGVRIDFSVFQMFCVMKINNSLFSTLSVRSPSQTGVWGGQKTWPPASTNPKFLRNSPPPFHPPHPTQNRCFWGKIHISFAANHDTFYVTFPFFSEIKLQRSEMVIFSCKFF